MRAREVDPASLSRARWTSCALTGRRLSWKRGVVACRARGRLYDKEAALERILARRGAFVDDGQLHAFANGTNDARKARATKHLRERKDFFDVRDARRRRAGDAGDADDDSFEPECPILGLVAGRTNERFVAARPCGCVVSKRATDAVGAAARDACLACGEPVVETTTLFRDDDDDKDDIQPLDRSRASKRPRLARDVDDSSLE